MAAAAPPSHNVINAYGKIDPKAGVPSWHITSEWTSQLKLRTVTWLTKEMFCSEETATSLVRIANERVEKGNPFNCFPILDGQGILVGLFNMRFGQEPGALEIGALGLHEFEPEQIREILGWCLHTYLPALHKKNQMFPVYIDQKLFELVPLSHATLKMHIRPSTHGHLGEMLKEEGFVLEHQHKDRDFYQLPVSKLLANVKV